MTIERQAVIYYATVIYLQTSLTDLKVNGENIYVANKLIYGLYLAGSMEAPPSCRSPWRRGI